MGQMLDAWAAVLDRSFEQLAEASADARTFDRSVVAEVADVWDNNTFAFVAAASAGRASRREDLAREGLWWMADFGAKRHRWVLDQAAAGGHAIDLPAISDAGGIWRDYAGRVGHRPEPLAAEVASALVVDYDLATARVKYLLAERSRGRLEGTLLVEAERRFTVDADYPAAELDLRFEGLDALRFELDDARGVALDCDDGMVSVDIGDRGILRASGGTMWNRDRAWHHSRSGRAADAVTPAKIVRPTVPPRTGRVRGTAQGVAHLLRAAMLEIRMVRYPSWAHQIAVHRLAQTFRGAGTAVLEAGSAFRRDAAFQRLIDRWSAKAGAELAPWLESTLDGRWPEFLAAAPDSSPVVESELLLVEYSAERPPHPSGVVLQLASPGEPWQHCGVEVEEPDRFAVRLEAFSLPLGDALPSESLALSGFGG